MEFVSSQNNEINSESMLVDRHIATVVTETTIFALVTIISFLGNLLVCYALYRNPRLRNASNYYFTSLALSDIFSCKQVALCLSRSFILSPVNGLLGLLSVHLSQY